MIFNVDKNLVKAPWIDRHNGTKAQLEYTDLTMYNRVKEIAGKYSDYIAYEFMGKKTTYKKAIEDIDSAAKALKAIGVKQDDRVTICLPNCPQAVTMFYAVNKIGAIGNMIHPLSSEKEIEFYLKDSKSKVAITLDQFYGKFQSIMENTDLETLLIASIKDALSPVIKLGYALTEGRKIAKLPKNADRVMIYKDFLKKGESFNGKVEVKRAAEDPAVILYSGGTTGVTKGILLSNINFNALGLQIAEMSHCFAPGKVMLAVMPIFHGFGLGVSIHSMLVNGGKCILVPRFTAESYAVLIKKKRPNYIAGVPTLFEALLRMDTLDGVDLSCLLGVFSGGDSLSPELKNRFDKFLKDHNCKVAIREGYGTTECVTASCLTPYDQYVEGSIGIPMPDMYYKIVKPNTEEQLPYGEEGEICLAGPTVMMEYVNHPEETANTKRLHSDGLNWIHTGDLGYMDESGFVYFRQRIKRMIVTNGYNVYPSNIENVLDKHEAVHMNCVIGVKDPLKMQRVKAFIMLKEGYEPSEELKKELIEFCKTYIAKYAVPYDIEFRNELPKTLVGKVAYRKLEEEEQKKAA